MSAAEIIESAFLDGMSLAITAEGQLHYSGQEEVVARWLQALRENKTGILVELARFNKPATKADNGNADISSRWWRFHYTDREPKEASYSPAATHAHALAGEPDAITAEAFEPIRQLPDKPLSEEDEASVRALLAGIGEADEGMITVALEQCRTGQDARDAFLQLAKQW